MRNLFQALIVLVALQACDKTAAENCSSYCGCWQEDCPETTWDKVCRQQVIEPCIRQAEISIQPASRLIPHVNEARQKREMAVFACESKAFSCCYRQCMRQMAVQEGYFDLPP